MTLDDIIRIGREHLHMEGEGAPYFELELFAYRIAAAEREACANLWEASKLTDKQIAEQIEAAVQAEREACAKVCDEIAADADIWSREESYVQRCAAAIRARGDNGQL